MSRGRAGVRRSGWAVVLVICGLVGGQIAWGATSGAQLRRNSTFAIVGPADGAVVHPGFILSWRPLPTVADYAVFIDHNPPSDAHVIAAGDSTVLIHGATMLRLTIADRAGGSPTTRSWHTVTVVPVDSSRHRVGEQVAVVHVRARG